MNNHLSIKYKFSIATFISINWAIFSIWVSQRWFEELSIITGQFVAFFLITFIAIIPGFINMFVFFSLLFDKRPIFKKIDSYPNIDILIAAYNEENTIQETIKSILSQDYPSSIHIYIVNDGSQDNTKKKILDLKLSADLLTLIDLTINKGKANALNIGLNYLLSDLVITIDADCLLIKNSIKNLVSRYLSDPPNTKAVAGTILVGNSRKNWLTKVQEWDYFLGISAVKRIQSMYQGTLVAQGAFSLYERQTVSKLGGWPNMVGEDIVLTWNILKTGWRVGHAENACVFTKCPDTLLQFIKQRQRWSRGLIEAFKQNPQIIFKLRLNSIYIWWNLLFPFIDIAYTFGFIPGLILALTGRFWIVGPMTLALIPPSLILNNIMYRAARHTFINENITIRKNLLGFILYILAYGLILQPACVYGYISELLGFKKVWGTKQ
ncbi:glycosyltransferase family 2 protein [Ferrovum sp. PN-J185]|uniref:glycosyltransferase family 2 protein n=1 Tax=Ferrovum sp. PN-J185 TaxID=1356306 RepID=UPI0008314671|nr:glycosyltransferase [Ferrovum sp. PN-J185]MCC6067583.1 glycosyltransferase family 2 protein [Ferrovum sp. PN-J185]MDE2056494.1 glycosyltransferase family 2 protein [Betaproteobacteria bacterium]